MHSSNSVNTDNVYLRTIEEEFTKCNIITITSPSDNAVMGNPRQIQWDKFLKMVYWEFYFRIREFFEEVYAMPPWKIWDC